MSYLYTSATFSPGREHRYHLLRLWDVSVKPLKLCMFIGLNPSTADEKQDDPTVRRCVAFAKRLGCHGMHMMNIFAYRATDPDVMKRAFDPVGEDNDDWLRVIALDSAFTIACWGVHGQHLSRGVQVKRILSKITPSLCCFGMTKDGHPKHPLYLKADSPLVAF